MEHASAVQIITSGEITTVDQRRIVRRCIVIHQLQPHYFLPFSAENDECALDSDCKIEGASCQNARCTTTKIKAKLTSTKLEYRRSFYVLDKPCESNADCSDISNSVCSPLTKKCVCKRGFFYDSADAGCIGGDKQNLPQQQL